MMEPYRAKTVLNIKKIQGQLSRIGQMIDEDRYCIDIAQQVNAAIGMLKQINSNILESHLICCGSDKLTSKNEEERKAFAKELVQAFSIKNK